MLLGDAVAAEDLHHVGGHLHRHVAGECAGGHGGGEVGLDGGDSQGRIPAARATPTASVPTAVLPPVTMRSISVLYAGPPGSMRNSGGTRTLSKNTSD